ncbi:MAG: polysaccharide biosynthesis C-terminal domain-containing protein, partial [Kiritimatiellae bacterium]|nr:polysaccharide biosynthesis C-terminal domain-containing protein [Kiritimatiellia bacterium]
MIRDERFLRREFNRTLIPVMLSVLAGTVNTLVDSVFISQKLGSAGLAAVNMCGPIYQVICVLGSLLATGGSILSAHEEGRDRPEEARKYFYTSVNLCLLLGAAFSAAGFFFCRPAALFLAQGSSLSGYIYDYCLVTFIGIIPVAFAYIPLYYLQLAGKRREITIMMVIVIALNVILDALFLFVMNFQMRGAAAASVISFAAACCYGASVLQSGFSNYRFSRWKLGFYGSWDIVKYGSPVAGGNLFDAARLFLLNAIILRAGGEQALVIWAVLNALSELSLSFISGVPQAAAPIIGLFYAPKENSGIRILMKLQMKEGFLFTGVYALFLLGFHTWIARLFAVPSSLLFPLFCMGIGLFFEMSCSILANFYNVTGNIVLSNVLNAMYRLFFPVGFALFFAGAGRGLWLFLPFGGILSLLIITLVSRMISAYSKRDTHFLSGFLLLDDYLEREKLVLDFSVETAEQSICDASERIRDFCAENQMDAKTTNRLGLAIEELMMVMKEKIPGADSMDLRVFSIEDSTGIRIRSA